MKVFTPKQPIQSNHPYICLEYLFHNNRIIRWFFSFKWSWCETDILLPTTSKVTSVFFKTCTDYNFNHRKNQQFFYWKLYYMVNLSWVIKKQIISILLCSYLGCFLTLVTQQETRLQIQESVILGIFHFTWQDNIYNIICQVDFKKLSPTQNSCLLVYHFTHIQQDEVLFIWLKFFILVMAFIPFISIITSVGAACLQLRAIFIHVISLLLS